MKYAFFSSDIRSEQYRYREPFMEETKLALSAEQEKQLHNAIRNLRIALKNSVFYESDHPLYVSSIDNFNNADIQRFT